MSGTGQKKKSLRTYYQLSEKAFTRITFDNKITKIIDESQSFSLSWTVCQWNKSEKKRFAIQWLFRCYYFLLYSLVDQEYLIHNLVQYTYVQSKAIMPCKFNVCLINFNNFQSYKIFKLPNWPFWIFINLSLYQWWKVNLIKYPLVYLRNAFLT